MKSDQEFVERFSQMYMEALIKQENALGGKANSYQRSRVRAQVRRQLAKEFPDQVNALQRYNAHVSDYMMQNGARKGIPKAADLPDKAKYGWELERQLRARTNSLAGRMVKRSAPRPERGTISSMLDTIRKHGKLPNDAMLASLLNVSLGEIRTSRQQMLADWDFVLTDDGWTVTPKPPLPAPQPASLHELVEALSDDEKVTLRELLANLRK